MTEADILLASASDAVVIGFNTKVEAKAQPIVKREGVQVKLFSIIYELIDQVEEAMLGVKPELKRLAATLITPERPGDMAQALMDLGATICTPRSPACGRCPIASACLAQWIH